MSKSKRVVRDEKNVKGGDDEMFQVDHGSVVELPIELIEPNPWNP